MISPKNSREAVKHLLEVSNATHLIVSEEFLSYAMSLELSIPVVLFQEQEEGEVDLTEYAQLTEEEREFESNLPSFYLHTSGSTGHPKLIGQVSFGRLPR